MSSPPLLSKHIEACLVAAVASQESPEKWDPTATPAFKALASALADGSIPDEDACLFGEKRSGGLLAALDHEIDVANNGDASIEQWSRLASMVRQVFVVAAEHGWQPEIDEYVFLSSPDHADGHAAIAEGVARRFEGQTSPVMMSKTPSRRL